MAPGVVAKQPEAADIGVEIVAHQPGKFRRPFLPAVAVIRLHVAGDHQPLLVEGEPRAQVHRARETTLDHVGGLVLVGIDAGQQLRRDVVELQAARRVRRKAVAAIELGPDERKTADKHLRRFARGVGGIVGGLQAIDRNARNALDRAGRGLVRERANVGSGDRIDERGRILLDRLRSLERASHADDHDLVLLGRRCFGQVLVLR